MLKDLLSLSRPRIAGLQMITCAVGYLLAASAEIKFWPAVSVLIGGGILSCAASILNSVWERDIDALMERTKHRPVAVGRMSAVSATWGALLFAAVGFAILLFGTNVLTTLIVAAGVLFYLLVYTLLLKRTTALNIVIGGVSGAVPPLAGWAAASGELSVSSFLMFLVIFLWTPPHFWALCMGTHNDYEKAGVPMMPIVAGERATVRQMIWYVVLLLASTVALAGVEPKLSIVTMLIMLALGGVFLWRVLALQSVLEAAEDVRRRRMMGVFGYSIVYLCLFFVTLAIDSLV